MSSWNLDELEPFLNEKCRAVELRLKIQSYLRPKFKNSMEVLRCWLPVEALWTHVAAIPRKDYASK